MRVSAAAGTGNADPDSWSLVESTSDLWELVDLPPPPPARHTELIELGKLLKEVDLEADGIGASLAVSLEEVYHTIMPLVHYILQKKRDALADGRSRVLIGIGGSGGSGKTTLAKVLRIALNYYEANSTEVLGMDAYHLPNAELEARTVAAPGGEVSLRTLKGTIGTFDVSALLDDLERLQLNAAESISLPEYDRNLHEPAPDRVQVDQKVSIVLVEGLFVVGDTSEQSTNRAPASAAGQVADAMWTGVHRVMDAGVIISGHQPTIRERMLIRQTRQRRSLSAAEAHYDRVDAVNARQLADRHPHADAVLHMGANGGFLPQQVEVRMKRGPSVLVLGLNAALQKTITVPELKKGGVVRADDVAFSVGGKGQGAARAASACAESAVLLAHFLGGQSGQFLQQQISDLGIYQVTREVQCTTRTATTILCLASGTATEVIDPSLPLQKSDVAGLLEDLKESVVDCRALGLCGTLPPGVTAEFYRELAMAAPPSTRVLLDGYREMDSLLVSKRVDVLKINSEEVMALTGETDVPSAVAACFEKYLSPSAHLAITNGADAAHLYSATGVWTYRIPKIEATNPIGAGDTCAGVMLYSLGAGEISVPQAFKLGLAAACASCLESQGAEFDWKVAHRMMRQMSCTYQDLSAEVPGNTTQ